MSTFIKLLPLELEDIDINNPPIPFPEIGENEEKVSNHPISPYCQKIYIYYMKMRKSISELEYQFGFTSPHSQKSQLINKMNEMECKANLLNSLTWISVREELGIWDMKYELNIRAGGYIVRDKQGGNAFHRGFRFGLSPFLDMLFGSGGPMEKNEDEEQDGQ